jgi:proline iminopeptidase
MLEDAPTYLQRVQEFLQINTPQPQVGWLVKIIRNS